MQKISKILSMHAFDTPNIFKNLIEAHKALAELKWVASTIPNATILTSTLWLQEAKDSSAIENIITTQDELYKSDALKKQFASVSAKEVYSYADALQGGRMKVKETWLIMNQDIVHIQSIIEQNDAWFRKLPGTELKNDKTGETVYVPPQNHEEILDLMSDLESFINTDTTLDPLIQVAIVHHQFESIHPFYDGNGRVGRIINVLLLVKAWLLDSPILYLSRYINQHKKDYYRLLQSVRDDASREDWILWMLQGIQDTARNTIVLIHNIKQLMISHKQLMRSKLPKVYSQDLLNNIFKHPYTKIDFVMKDLWCGRQTATKYLDQLALLGILSKKKIGRESYYINIALYKLLLSVGEKK